MKPGPKPTLPDARCPGVYQIANTTNSKRYIGSAFDITQRLDDHRKALRGNRHINAHLQAAWNKYGEAVFVLRVIERCAKEDVVKREQYWIDKFKSADREYGYNACPTAGNMAGFKHSEESKKEMSERLKGKPVPQAMTEASIKYWKGRSLPKHVLDKAAVVNKKRLTGVPKTPETKAKMAEAARALWATRKRREQQAKEGRGSDGKFAPKPPDPT